MKITVQTIILILAGNDIIRSSLALTFHGKPHGVGRHSTETTPKARSISNIPALPIHNTVNGIESRRNILSDILKRGAATGAVLAVAALTSDPSPAIASGGATAGGVYLLSAKQRYNRRVTSGIKEYAALSSSLESGDLSATKAFFKGTDEGTWGDLVVAGYLLSNAFRTSSGTPPDRLPSVKKWKAFQKAVDDTEKCAKKKDSKGALASYNTSIDLLDAYLDGVELPSVLEITH